jgi:hypothetical protein
MTDESTSPRDTPAVWRTVVAVVWIVFVFAYFILRALDYLGLMDLPFFGD